MKAPKLLMEAYRLSQAIQVSNAVPVYVVQAKRKKLKYRAEEEINISEKHLRTCYNCYNSF